MPGVTISTSVRSGPAAIASASSSNYFLVGTAERGPAIFNASAVVAGVAPQLVTSMTEFTTYFGGYNASTNLWQNAKIFFEEGGTRCYVGRVVGASNSTGTITLNKSGASAALTLTAANPGAWSTSLQAEVLVVTGGFVINLYLNSVKVYTTGTVATVADAVNKFASSATAKIYATATAVDATAVLVALSPTSFSAGSLGNAPAAADYVSALTKFDQSYGTGAVAIPGQAASATWAGLISHAKTYNRVALLAEASGAATATVIASAATYAATSGAENAAFYYPHVTMLNDAGVTLTVSPESYVAAKRALAHSNIGPHQPGAGLISQASFITGLNAYLTKSDGDTLDAARVNSIRTIQGYPRVYGARSLSNDDDNYRYITAREVLNYVVTEAEKRLEDLLFAPIDARKGVFGLIEARIIALMEPLRAEGAIFEGYDVNGALVDPGYSVVVDDSINPTAQLAQGIVKARIGVRVSSVADQIYVDILKSSLTSPVV